MVNITTFFCDGRRNQELGHVKNQGHTQRIVYFARHLVLLDALVFKLYSTFSWFAKILMKCSCFLSSCFLVACLGTYK